jgi:hypothetical protein
MSAWTKAGANGGRASIGLIIIHFMEILNFSKDYLLGVAEAKRNMPSERGAGLKNTSFRFDEHFFARPSSSSDIFFREKRLWFSS